MLELNCHAILFDLDGVLVDSTACVERHWRVWAARYDLDANLILAHSHGKRSIDTLRAVASHLDLDLEREARLLELEETRDLEGIVATPGALELVAALPSECWAIVTSATRGMAVARLEAVGLPIPGVFVTAEAVHEGKPHPEGYLKAASLLGATPRDCLVIEDAPAGIQAARAGDIRVLALTTTFPAEKLYAADNITSGLQSLGLTVTRDQTQRLPWLTLRIGTSKE
jgi:mannitol-1-/sugar-/sorbitol-6-phosphatase